MDNRYADFIIKWRWAVVLLTIMSVMLAGSGAKNLSFTSNYRVFFDDKNAELEAFERLQNTYSKSDNILIVLIPKSENVFETNTLRAITELTEASWQIQYSSRVDSITNYQHSYSIGDDLIVEDLISDLENASSSDIAKAKKIALSEPLINGRLISATGHVAAVNATIQLPENDETAIREVMEQTREIVAELEKKYPDIQFAITGLAALSNAFAESAENDVKTLIPLMFLIIILTLAFLLRSLVATLSVVVVILFSVISAMGMFGWIGFTLSPPTTSIPTIVMTVAVADSVHILITFFQGMRSGLSKIEAMQKSLHLNLKAVIITSLTTALGFLSMNFSEVPPFQQVGSTVAIGVVAALLLSIAFLPALMMILPIKPKVIEQKNLTIIEKYAELLIKYRNSFLIGSVVVSLALVAAVPLNQVNDEFIKYFHTKTKFRQDTDLVSEKLTGIYSMGYSLGTEEQGGINDPAFIADVEKFVNWLESQPEVMHVYSFTDTFKKLNKNMHGDDEEWYKLPEDKALAAQYLLLYEMSLPYGLDLNDQINIEKSAIRITVTLQNIKSVDNLRLEREANQWLRDNTEIKDFYVASPNMMFAHIGERNVRAIIAGSLWALLGISLILIFALRSWKLGLISIVPNLLPAGIAFGLWGIFNGNLGLSITSAIGMTLGIVVDDTVHFLMKYKVGRSEKAYSPEDAVRYAFSEVGTALFVTTFVLVSGFMVLATSMFIMNVHQGVFTAMTIGVALILDFVFLPSFLLLIEEKSNVNQKASNKIDDNALNSIVIDSP